jgi:bifunctional polynucleotide phosphatase/kinase
MSLSTSKKRPADDKDRSVSPPPLKRKAQSTITSMSPCKSRTTGCLPTDANMASESAVANFFTPTSKKPKDRTTWSERSAGEGVSATLLVGKYVPEKGDDEPLAKRRKIAAFDLVRVTS